MTGAGAPALNQVSAASSGSLAAAQAGTPRLEMSSGQVRGYIAKMQEAQTPLHDRFRRYQPSTEEVTVTPDGTVNAPAARMERRVIQEPATAPTPNEQVDLISPRASVEMVLSTLLGRRNSDPDAQIVRPAAKTFVRQQRVLAGGNR